MDAAEMVGAGETEKGPIEEGIEVKKTDRPSEHFIGAILRGFDKAETEGKAITCSSIWDYVVMECLGSHDGFRVMFAWDTSKAQNINRIGTIAECIERGYVPGLKLRREGRATFIERY